MTPIQELKATVEGLLPHRFPSSQEKVPHQARTLVVEHVYFQPAAGQPREVTSRYSARTESEEEPYSRVIRTGTGPLDFGWLTDSAVSLVVVSCSVGAVRLLSCEVPFAVVPAGESCRFRPCPEVLKRLSFSATPGTVFTLTSYPG